MGVAITALKSIQNGASVGTTQLAAAFSALTPVQIANLAASNNLSEAQLKEALRTSSLTLEVKKQVWPHYDAATAKTADKAATDGLTFSVGKLTTALWANIKAGLAWIATNPFGMIVGLAAAVAIGVGSTLAIIKKHNEAIQETIDNAQELQDAYNQVDSEINSDISAVENISDEFKTLSKGVSENGENVSLSADEYDRYLEIVNQLVDINPTLVKGYTAEGNAIIDKNSVIQETIDLLKEQSALELRNATSDENNWAIAEGLSNAYEQKRDAAKQAESDLLDALQTALYDNVELGFDYEFKSIGGVNASELYNQIAEMFGVSDLANAAGINQTQWTNLFHYIEYSSTDVSQVIADNLEHINNLLGDGSTAAREFNQAFRSWQSANNQADQAAFAYQSQMKLIAQAADGYDELSSGSKEFLNNWIEMWELTGDETKESVGNITTSIWQMIALLKDNSKLNAMLQVDYESLSDSIRKDYQQAVNDFLNELVESGEITLEQAAELRLAMGITMIDPDTGEEVDVHHYLVSKLSRMIYAAGLNHDDSILDLSVSELQFALTLDPSTYNSWESFFNAVKTGAVETAESLAQLTGLTENLKTFEEAFDELSDALAEFNEDGHISADTVADLIEAFGDTDAMRDLIATLGDTGATSEQVKEKLNVLGNEYLNTSGLLATLDENTIGWVGSVLESKGVLNGTAVALQKYKQMTVEAEIAVQNFTSSLLTNTKALESLGMKTEARGLIQLINIFQNIVDTSTNADQIAKAQAYVDQYTSQLNAMETLWDDVEIDWGVSVSPTPSKSSSSDDPWLDAFEAEYNKHKHLVHMEQETLSDYYAWLEQANKQYFEGRTKYIDEYRKYTEEVFDGLRDLAEDAVDDAKHQITLLENQRDALTGTSFDTNSIKQGKNQQIIQMYKDLQNRVHETAESIRKSMRDAGWSEIEIENSDVISELSEQWWEFEDEIKDVKQQIVDDLLDIVTATSDAVDSIQEVYDTLHEAADEFAEYDGILSVDTFQSLVELGPEYMQYLRDENGLLIINEEAINKVIAAKTQQLALDNAMAYVERLKLALQSDSIEDLNKLLYATTETTSATWGLVYANLALLDLTDDQYQAALHNINSLRSLADNAVQSIGMVRESLSDTLQEMKDGMDDILDYVMDMIQWEIEQQIEALEDAKDAYKELIDLKKESMDATEKETEYQDEVADKVKEIAKLQERINALSLDDGREAQAEKVSLEEELRDLQKELSDYQADYSKDKQEESLDDMLEAYEKEKDEEIEVLEDSISSTQKLYELAIDRIGTRFDTLYSDLLTWNRTAGNSIESEIVTAWENCMAAVQRYGSYVAAMGQIDADVEASKSTGTNLNVGRTDSYDESTGSSYASAGQMRTVSSLLSKMKANSKAWQTSNADQQRDLEEENAGIAQQIGDIIQKKVLLNTKDGVWYIDHIGGDKLYDLQDADILQKYIYHTGGIAGDVGTLKENELLAKLEDGEAVISNSGKTQLFSLIDFADKLMRKLNFAGTGDIASKLPNITPKLSQVTNNGAPSIQFGDVYITGADKSTVEEHRRINREFTQEIVRQLGIRK